MQTEEPIKISDAEWEIMRVVWTLGSADAKTLTDILGERMGWKAATVKTLLGRLVKKEILTTEQVGKKFKYHPAVTEEATVRSATANLFAHICAKKIGRTIAELIDEAELTLADLDLIEAAVQAKKPEAVAEIACNCIPGQCECSYHQA